MRREAIFDRCATCPKCMGQGRHECALYGVLVSRSYCAGARRVTQDDADVYVRVLARNAAIEGRA